MSALNKPSKDTFPPLLSLTYVLQHLCDQLLAKQVGVGLSSMRIMSTLSFVPISQRAVAVALHQTEANVSRQLQAMKKQGLVSVTKSKYDGRQRDVILTSKGTAKYKKGLALLKGQQKSFYRTLDKSEHLALAEFSERLLQKLG